MDASLTWIRGEAVLARDLLTLKTNDAAQLSPGTSFPVAHEEYLVLLPLSRFLEVLVLPPPPFPEASFLLHPLYFSAGPGAARGVAADVAEPRRPDEAADSRPASLRRRHGVLCIGAEKKEEGQSYRPHGLSSALGVYTGA